MSTPLVAYPAALQLRMAHPLGNRRLWFAMAVALMLMLMGMQAAFASSYACSSASLQSPFPARIVDSANHNGALIASGNLVVTLTGCKNNSSDGNTSFQVAVPTDGVGEQLLAAPGIRLQSTALPASPVISGDGCSLGSSSYSNGSTLVAFTHPVGATCNYRVSFPLSLTMQVANGSISGQVASDLTNRAASLGAHGWLLYSGTNSDYLGLSSSLELIATACTLSTPQATVTLPTLSVKALTGGAGKTAGRTPFTVALSSCSNGGSAYAAKASWAFDAGADPTFIANSASSPASNVSVQMLDSAFKPISNGATTTVAQVSGGVATSIQHYVQYVAGTGTVGPGNVKGIATLNLFYE